MPTPAQFSIRRPMSLALFAIMAGAAAPLAMAQCPTPAWNSGMNFPGIQGDIKAAVVYNGELYVGGSIFLAGSTSVTGLAKWNGQAWSLVGGVFANPNSSGGVGTSSTTPGSVSALCVSGGRLYVGGTFRHTNTYSGSSVTSVRATNLASYDGTVFRPLGSPVSAAANNTTIMGPGLIQNTAGAEFSISSLAAGPNGQIYIGGDFDSFMTGTTITAIASRNIAVYDPTTNRISAVCAGGAELGGSSGGGIITSTSVKQLAVYNDGTGAHLYAGGLFQTMGGVSTGGFAELIFPQGNTCGTWVPVGGVTSDFGVGSMVVFDADGAGPDPESLYLSGLFADFPGVGCLKWDGVSRSPVGSSVTPTSLATYDDGSGTKLYASTVGGSLLKKLNTATNTWEDVAGTFGHGANPANGTIPLSSVLASYTPAGGSSQLYVMGNFTHVNTTVANNVARWNGGTWSPVPAGMGPAQLFNSASGGALAGGIKSLVTVGNTVFAAGTFESIGGIIANHVAAFDGTTWTPMGNGVGQIPGQTDYPRTLVSYHDGAGSSLYAVCFTDANTLRRWTGSSWETIPGGPDGNVYTAAVHDGSIYVAGAFTSLNSGSITASNIAAWNPAQGWHSPTANTFSATVFKLATHNGKLYAGGLFTTIDGSPANNVAVLTPSGWAPLVDSVSSVNGVSGTVQELVSYQGKLYVGGSFTSPAAGVVRWDDTTSTWSSIGGATGGFSPTVYSMSPGVNAAGNPVLFVGGRFTTVGATAANGIAQFDASSGTWSSLVTSGVNGVTTNAALPTTARAAGNVGTLASIGTLLVVGGGDFSTFNDAGGTGSVNLATWGCPPPICPADFNGDGFVDGFDYDDFVACFEGDPQHPCPPGKSSDFNGDGFPDGFDYDDFVTAFETGC